MKADKACIDVAAGRTPADLVFKNVNVVNVFSEEIITADVAVAGGVIAGVGSYRGRTELDCTDKFLCPGFIDAHIHMNPALPRPLNSPGPPPAAAPPPLWPTRMRSSTYAVHRPYNICWMQRKTCR